MRASILALTALAAAVATPALAGPCERMSGARWLVYFERDFQGVRSMSTGVIDFRNSASLGPAYFARGPVQIQNGYPGSLSTGFQHGDAELRGATCANETDPVAAIGMSSAEPIRVSVAADGRSAIVLSDQGLQIGQAERLPNPPPVSAPRRR